MNERLSSGEVAEQLRRAIRGEVSLTLTGGVSWDETYAGDCEFRVGGWTVVFFNDCDSLDYCDSARSQDGLVGDYDEWMQSGNGRDPTDMLDDSEVVALEVLLKSAKAYAPKNQCPKDVLGL